MSKTNPSPTPAPFLPVDPGTAGAGGAPALAPASAPAVGRRAALALQQQLGGDSFERTSLHFDLMGQRSAPEPMRLKLETNLALVTSGLRRLNTELDRNALAPSPGTLNLGDL